MIQAGAAFAGLAVIFGALAAHEMKNVLNDKDLAVFETAVRYNFYHALALLAIGYGARRLKENVGKAVFALFVVGIILFSGSLYLLATSKLWAEDRIEWLGAVAPLGGVSFVAGWFYLAFKGYKPSSSEETRSGKKVMEMQRRKPVQSKEEVNS